MRVENTLSGRPVSEAGVNTDVPYLRIEPSKGWISLRLGELFRYRELIYFLTWRDVKVRYKQTLLGAAWAILQPLMTMAVFTIFFNRLAGVTSDGPPYPIFVLAGLIPWTFFSIALTQSSNSLVGSANLIKKVYFPRLTVPLGAVLAGIVDFGLSFALLLCGLTYYRLTPSWNVLYLPLFFLLAVVTSLGVGLWLSALNVRFRDVRHAIPFLMQFWMLATPIGYTSARVPEAWRALLGLNPMAGVVEGFRWALLGSQSPVGGMVLVSAGISLLVFVSGLYYFRHMEKSFADIV